MSGGGGIVKSIGNAFSGIGNAVSNVVKGVGNAISTVAKNPIFQAVAPIALNYFLPGIGTAVTGAFGLSAAWAPTIGGALTGGVLGALGGKGLGGALKGAAIGGLASGVADYAMNGTNPLSGLFGSSADPNSLGGINPLTAGGSGSTQLTGSGTGLGLDKSTLGTQFGQLNPNPSSAPFGSLNPNPSSSPWGALAGTAKESPGFFSSLANGNLSGAWDAGKSALGKLVPDSTLGKVALGGAALSLLGGGSKPQQAAPPSSPPGLDPSFNQRLQKLNFDYGINRAGAPDYNRLKNYGVNYTYYNPATGRFEARRDASGQDITNPNAPEAAFTQTSFTPQAAGGGMMPMGGLAQYASGGMPDVETDHGYLSGPGDGVSDDIPAMIGDSQPARLAGGEFVIPARIVSELGNGSSDAGAQRLHQMMERVNNKRLNTKDFAKDSKAYKLLPA